MKLREKLWLWGHGRQCENIEGQPLNLRGRPGIGRLNCAEAAREMGIPNICRIVIEPAEKPPYDEELRTSSDMENIVWSVLGCGKIDARCEVETILENAKKYPNITGGIMDDFFPNTNHQKTKIYTPEVLKNMRSRLHTEAGRKLDLWVVVYRWDFEYENFSIKPYLDECDVATIWTYNPQELVNLEDTYKKMRSVWGYDRPLYAGCYMWSFAEKKPISSELMKLQLDTYYKWIKEGKIDGIIFCHNYLVDLDIEAVHYTKQWIKDHAEEIISR